MKNAMRLDHFTIKGLLFLPAENNDWFILSTFRRARPITGKYT
jgi:hypothetical protein